MPISFFRCPPVVVKVFRECRFLTVSQALVPADLFSMIPTLEPDVRVYLRYMSLLKHLYYRTTGANQPREEFSTIAVFAVRLFKGRDVPLALSTALRTFIVVYHVKPPHPLALQRPLPVLRSLPVALPQTCCSLSASFRYSPATVRVPLSSGLSAVS